MTKKTILSALCIIFLLSRCTSENDEIIMTVNGPVPAGEMGVSLIHEHILVDFIGADSISYNRWDKSKVIEKAFPYLKQIKDLGCATFIECTPAFLGRDPSIMKRLSDTSGLKNKYHNSNSIYFNYIGSLD